MKRILQALRGAEFLSRERIAIWSGMLIAGYLIAIFWLGLSGHGLKDYAGRPLGTDFSGVYAAGILASHHHASAPFDIAFEAKQEQALFGPATPIYGWHYPPFFLLVAAPLAQLPYLAALVVWQVATLVLYLCAIWLLLKKSPTRALLDDPFWVLPALGFTALFVNVTHGHNGFLTAALFGAALALLDERPVIAGVLLGLLVYKPQFGILVPIVLGASNRWKSFFSAAATVGLLTIVVTVLFGNDIWHAFFAATEFTRKVVLEHGSTGFYKMQSVFALVRLWGGSVAIAYCAQLCVAITALSSLVALWRSDMAMGYKKAALCLAALMVTPYSLDYDLMLLAPAITLLVAQGVVDEFLPYEKSILALLWLLPAAARVIARFTLVPLVIPLIILLYGMTLWRMRKRGFTQRKLSKNYGARLADRRPV